MIEVVGKILLGLGLMFTGVQMLSSGLKYLGSRQFRMLATRFVSSRTRAITFGLGSGALIQSTSAALVILASLICTGLINVEQAIAILTGFSVGNCLLVFVVSLNIAMGVMFVVGLCGIAMYLSKDDKLRNYLAIGLGLGLIFFGIEIMVAGVKPLQKEAWFAGAMAFSRHYSGLSVAAGVVLGFISQSSTAVALVAIGLAKNRILDGPQTFLFIYGAAIGSTMLKVVLGKAFGGTSRQLVRFVNLFNIFGAAVFILLYYIEVHLHVPLIMALLNALKVDLDHQAAWAFLLFNLTSAIFFTAVNRPLVRWLAKTLPPSEEEDLAQPKYLHEFGLQEPESALELIRLEQARELEQIAALISTAGREYAGLALNARHDAFRTLAEEVTSSSLEVAAVQMQQQTANRLAYLYARQALLDQLAESTAAGAQVIAKARAVPCLETLSDSCMESVDFLLLLAVEAEGSNLPDHTNMLLELASSNGPTMERLRKAYMDGDKIEGAGAALSSPEDKACLLDLMMRVEKIIWLLSRLLSLKQPA
jgi:phosphate:Na+ symporter